MGKDACSHPSQCNGTIMLRSLFLKGQIILRKIWLFHISEITSWVCAASISMAMLLFVNVNGILSISHPGCPLHRRFQCQLMALRISRKIGVKESDRGITVMIYHLVNAIRTNACRQSSKRFKFDVCNMSHEVTSHLLACHLAPKAQSHLS